MKPFDEDKVLMKPFDEDKVLIPIWHKYQFSKTGTRRDLKSYNDNLIAVIWKGRASSPLLYNINLYCDYDDSDGTLNSVGYDATNFSKPGFFKKEISDKEIENEMNFVVNFLTQHCGYKLLTEEQSLLL